VAKATRQKTGKTTKELLDASIAKAVSAGRELHLESVDFSDANRPKTCLEIDFPILPINHVSGIEGNAGKPIYQMSKWWARRRSSVFRAMLIAAATKAPDDSAEAARLVWDSYYGNHQKNKAFNTLKVADIFMGGGTTIIEGSRLGMQMVGNDLNPVAWFVVKNELAQVDTVEVKKLLDQIEAGVKPQIMPFYACDCPRGHKGTWKHKSTGQTMGQDFDALNLKPSERGNYQYSGPEVINTFWGKHGPCQATGCNHRTPIMSSPVIAVKTLTVKAWLDRPCRQCGQSFDVEQYEARMAPDAMLVRATDEKPYSAMNSDGNYACPHCGYLHNDQKARNDGESSSLGKAKNKSIELTLLVHPDWLKGSPGTSTDGMVFGGSTTDDAKSTTAWNTERFRSYKSIEVRGALESQIECPDTHEVFSTKLGTVPKKAHFTCAECGLPQDLLQTARRFGKDLPQVPFAIQGYCPSCDHDGQPYGGRFFANVPLAALNAACHEWEQRREDDLSPFWPRTELPYGMEADFWSVRGHGYTHFWKMFNYRQLLLHAILLKQICQSVIDGTPIAVQEKILSCFQQYLRNQCMFTLWNVQRDTLEPHFSKNNYRPKSLPVENCFSGRLGRGNWTSCCDSISETIEWSEDPWELVAAVSLEEISIPGKSAKARTRDPLGEAEVVCGSATALSNLQDNSVDLIITDPPFGDLIQYAELADYFYVWLRLALADRYPAIFGNEQTPKALEVVTNKARHPDDPDSFYSRLLTKSWTESARVLKPGGILAFTFHHSEDEPWVAVLESLFDAGFYLEGTFPIRSDETKGEGDFGSQQIEFDIVHVCRKRIDEPGEISWARLRRQILQDVRQLQEILEHHQQAGLAEADLKVIRRGKALEYYSKHYGKVYVEKGREFSVKEALTGINQLLDDQRDAIAEPPPVDAEPYTRQFLRLFADTKSLPRDQMQKILRGTGVSPAEFAERGWCEEQKKIFYLTPPLEQARKWKGAPRKGLGRDLDQAIFFIGACYESSGINVNDTLNNPNFSPHPATPEILDWFTRHGGDVEMKNAARVAKQLYGKWTAINKPKVQAVQSTLFDLFDGEA